MVTVMENPDLHAVPLLAVDRVGLASDMVIDPGGGEEVAFVGGIEKDFPGIGPASQRRDRADRAALDDDAFFTVEPFLAVDLDAEFLHVILEDLFRHARLEDPHGPVFAVDGGGALALIAILGLLLPLPGFLLLIFEVDAVVKIAGESSDDRLVAGVGEAEAAAGESAEMFVRTDDHDGLSHLLRLHRGDHGGTAASIDDEIVFAGFLLSPQRSEGGQDQGGEKSGDFHEGAER